MFTRFWSRRWSPQVGQFLKFGGLHFMFGNRCARFGTSSSGFDAAFWRPIGTAKCAEDRNFRTAFSSLILSQPAGQHSRHTRSARIRLKRLKARFGVGLWVFLHSWAAWWKFRRRWLSWSFRICFSTVFHCFFYFDVSPFKSHFRESTLPPWDSALDVQVIWVLSLRVNM